MVRKEEVHRLRALAGRWMEIASLPIMQKRKEVWRSIKDLKAVRPAILLEVATIDGFVSEEELVCGDAFLRNVEKSMLMDISHFEDIGDDVVLEPYFQVGWQLDLSGFGVEIGIRTARDMHGSQYGYKVESPIDSPEKVADMAMRHYAVLKEHSLQNLETLENIFGDILAVRIKNASLYEDQPGFSPHLGVNFILLTYTLQNLIGCENFLTWPYDCPDTLHRMSRLLTDDTLNIYRWMESEGLLSPNADNHWAGPGSYGYCSDLPPADTAAPAKLTDCWGRTESQESGCISPAMFNELYLPYIAEACRPFGLIYYGCCERLDDRFEFIREAIPNLRAVCVSPWNDFDKMAEYIGKDFVFSGKTNPAYLSSGGTAWDVLECELAHIGRAAKNCNLELIVRDLYRVEGASDG